MRGTKQFLVSDLLFNEVMMGVNERLLQRIVGKFGRVCNGRFKVYVYKGEVMYLER